VLTTGNVLLPFCNIDLAGGSGYLRDISPLKRIPLARKILLADDSVTAQNMGRKILADAGYEVITVNNGSAALKKIAETKPDLIVLDVYMPGYSGLEVCQRLKEVQETARIPVLLTVGKLEPFKPEEAKRVRAEGYIVKPFEASELLSALAKLEDKIVPRGEASKPGRFARANAALDEGRYDKSVAIEEDSGWKNRIAFPSKKKNKAAEDEDSNEAATYNPVNKDLRTVVETKAVPAPPEAKVEDDRVNLAALAPEGLPKDVTPEEIAALAAAAAQVKGKIAEFEVAATPPASSAVDEKPQEVAKPEVKREEVRHETQAVAEVANEALKEAPTVDAVTFAGQKAEEQKSEDQKAEQKIEAPAAKSDETPAETSAPAPSSAAVVAAMAFLENAAAPDSVSGNGSGLHTVASVPADEPVTMAAAAGAGSAYTSSRWTAVPVALAADESAISLEHEMQKAYAAFAAAETAHSEFVASVPEIHSAVAEPPAPVAASPSVEASVAEPVASTQETPAPEVAQAMDAVANAATEAISAAVKELEAVAASYSDLHPQVSSEPAAQKVSEPPTAGEAKAEEPPAEQASAPEPVATQEAQETIEEAKQEEQAHEESKIEEQKVDEPKVEEREPAAAAASVQTSDNQIAPDHAAPTKDSDIAATTAAAWASWRRIRESRDPKAADSPQDAAAMAVAAGAETTPEEASADSEPSDIANIVDSVLNDLRPKIFEEISRKMKKK